jgi:four helix bundle protein
MQYATRDTQNENYLNPLGYKKLIAWQKSDLLAHSVYDLTFNFPKEEVFGLTSQIRRAVISIVANIVEGYSRNSKKEFHHFLSISLGSLAEAEYFLEFAFKRGYIAKADFENTLQLKIEVGQLVWKLYLSQK